MILTEKLLRNVMKSGCGMKAAQARILNERWPLKAGWFGRAVGRSVTDDHYIELLNLRDGISKKIRKPRKKRRQKARKSISPAYLNDALDMPA